MVAPNEGYVALFNDEPTETLLETGRSLLLDDRAGEAVTSFRRALYHDQTARVWSALGGAYLSADMSERGQACLEEAVVVDNTRSKDRFTLVRSLLKHDDAARARPHIEQLAADVGDAETNYLLGKTYAKLSMWNEAIAAYQEVLEIEPVNIFARNNLGFSALQVGRNELALEQLERCLDLEPVRPFMLNNLGVAYERLDRPVEALAAFSRAAEFNGKYVKAVLNQRRLTSELTEEEQELAA